MDTKSWKFIVLFVICCICTPALGQKLKILPDLSSLSKPSNQKFVLTCRGDGSDANLFSELRWFTPRNEEISPVFLERNPDFSVMKLDENLYLTFRNPKPEASGKYRCRGLFQNSETRESEIQINIYEDVTWDHCPEVQYLIKGNIGERINCRASANPKPNIIWTKGSVQLDNNPRYFINSSGIVIKDSVTDDDGGLFQISALVTETGATHEKRITVQIYSRPKIERISENVEGIEDDQVKLFCEASGNPQPLYTWLDGNKRNLSSVGGYAVDRNEGSVIISRLKKNEDQGNFTCIAENSAGKSERYAQLLVYRRPKIENFLNVSESEDKESYLECRATGDPLPKLTIRKDGMSRAYQPGDAKIRLEERVEKYEQVLLLTFTKTARSDDGLYYCRAENKAGFIEKTGHLEVKFKPDMSLTPLTKVKTWDNRQINVTCIADAIPNATIKWYKSGYEIFENQMYRISDNGAGVSKLYITPTGLSYDNQVFGTYRCEGINSLGIGFINIDVERATVPGLVADVKAIDITPTLVKFKIFSDLYDGGMPIKKITVEYYNQKDPSDRKVLDFPYSKLENVYIIDRLRPFTHYRFRFSAHNEVGKGEFGQELHIQTKAETRPDKPEFHNLPYDTVNKDEIISPYPHKFTAMWNLPADNGRRIKYFEVKYYQIKKGEFGYTALMEPVIERVSMYPDEMTSITLQKLKSNSYYRAELRAYNDLGFSEPAEIIFKTPQNFDGSEEEMDEITAINASSVPIGLIAGIMIVIVILILLVMDIVFYFRYKVGAIYFLRSHICYTNIEDESKLNNYNQTISPTEVSSKQYSSSSSSYQQRRPQAVQNSEPKRIVEVDNPAFDYSIKPSNEEGSPMLGDRERFGFKRDQDSVV